MWRSSIAERLEIDPLHSTRLWTYHTSRERRPGLLPRIMARLNDSGSLLRSHGRMTAICNCGSARCMKAGDRRIAVHALRVPWALSRRTVCPSGRPGTGARAEPTYMDTVLTCGIARRGPALLGGRVMLRRIAYVGENISLYGFGGASQRPWRQLGGSPYRRREVSGWLSAGWRAGQDTAQASCMDCLPLSRPEQRRGNIPTVDNRAAVQDKHRHQVSLASFG